jgi:hypothetical protein
MPDVYLVLMRVLSIVSRNTALIIIGPPTRPPWVSPSPARLSRRRTRLKERATEIVACADGHIETRESYTRT